MDFAIDSHFHIWDLNNLQYDWPTENEPTIFRNFSADEYAQNIKQTPVKYGVFVQCINDSPAEALWVLNQKKPFIKGVVAGLDLKNLTTLEKDLQMLSKYPEFVGCRFINVTQDDWLSQAHVTKAMQLLTNHDKTFDILVKPHNLPFVPQLVSSSPSQRFVIDHMAKPYIKEGKITGWKEDMARIAQFPNVYCKISGLVTEADLDHWQIEDMRPYVEHILNVLGPQRCMFGSDWPVCNLANSDYTRTFTTYNSLLDHLTPSEKTDIFKNNAVDFYKLKID